MWLNILETRSLLGGGAPREEWQIVTLLRKSRIRKEVLGFLVSSAPDEINASSISKKLGYALCDVCGVLHGLSSRYKEENSLVALGLVEEMIKVRGSKGITLYRVTDRGKHIYERYYYKEVRR